MKIKLTDLEATITKIMASKYYSEEEAKLVTEVYMYAETMGKNTQGVLKLMGTEPSQNIKPNYPTKIIKDHKLAAIIDGGGATGPLAAQLAVNKAIEKAKEHGMSVVGLNNTFSSTGAIGFYASKMAENGLIGIVAANSPKGVNYNNVIEPVFGTNPIAFGFPTETHPIVFDMAASAITFYGLVRAKMLGQEIPEGIALDKEGNPTTDPAQAMEGSIFPFDKSYKSSGMALMVELLAGPLTGASFIFNDGDWGTFFLAIDPEILVGLAQFKKNASLLISKLKSARTKDSKEAHIPGYDSYKKREQILQSNQIEVDEQIWNELQNLIK